MTPNQKAVRIEDLFLWREPKLNHLAKPPNLVRDEIEGRLHFVTQFTKANCSRVLTHSRTMVYFLADAKAVSQPVQHTKQNRLKFLFQVPKVPINKVRLLACRRTTICRDNFPAGRNSCELLKAKRSLNLRVIVYHLRVDFQSPLLHNRVWISKQFSKHRPKCQRSLMSTRPFPCIRSAGAIQNLHVSLLKSVMRPHQKYLAPQAQQRPSGATHGLCAPGFVSSAQSRFCRHAPCR